MRLAIPEFQLVIPEQHDKLYKRLLSDIAHTFLPIRRHRINPRVLKKTVEPWFTPVSVLRGNYLIAAE